jgi:hypothetical protein
LRRACRKLKQAPGHTLHARLGWEPGASPTFANSLTTSNAAAGHYALQVITVVAVIFTPVVLIYQGWTYHVFRKRLGGEQVEGPVASVGATHDGTVPG